MAKPQIDKSELAFDLSISYAGKRSELGEICDLHITTVRPEDTHQLAKMAQAVLDAIGEYGQKSGEPWVNRVIPKEVTAEDEKRVIAFLKDHPMSTIEEISDALCVLQYTVAFSLSNLPKGMLDHTQPKYFLK